MLPTCLLLCLALAPGDPSEVELASALARRGWIDLADELCSRIEHLSGASVVLAEVAVARARQQPDPGVAVKVLDAAIARLGTRPTAEETTMAGFLRAEKARRLGDAQEAAKAWEEVEAFYQASIVELQKVPAGPTAEEALLDARLEMAKAMTARARLIVGNDSLRRKLLDQAIHLHLDFQLDTGTRPIAYEAILEE